MIDYFLQWSNEAAAQADALILSQKYYQQVATAWSQNLVLPNVKAWRPSQDIGGVHTFLTGWFAIVAWPTQVSILLNATALAFALDRNGPPYIVKNNIGAIINDVGVSPIFAGSHYPIGGYT